MNKIIYIIFAVLLMLGGGMAILPKYISHEKYKNLIVDKTNKLTGRALKVSGNLDIKLFPTPKITLYDVELSEGELSKSQYMVKSPKVELRFRLLSLLRGKYSLHAIDFFDADINLEAIDDKTRNWDFIRDLNNKGNSLEELKTFEIHNSNLNLVYSTGLKKTFDKVNLKLEETKSEIYELSGSVSGSSNNVAITSVTDTRQLPYKTKISLDSDFFNFQGDGVIDKDEASQKLKFSGKYDASLIKHDSIAQIIVSTFPFIPLSDSKELKAPIKISGSFDISENGINSKDLSVVAEETAGNGTFAFILDKDPSFNLAIKFSSINLDKIFSDKASQPQDASNSPKTDQMSMLDKGFINFNPDNQLDIYIDLDIAKLTLGQKDINDMVFKLGIKNNQLLFDKIQANLPNDFSLDILNSTSLVVDGVNVLVGDIKIKGSKLIENIEWLGLKEFIKLKEDLNNFDFAAKLVLAPNEITLLAIDTKMGESSITGRWTTKNLSEGVINYDIDLEIGKLELSSISLPQFHQIVDTLISKSNEKSYLSQYKFIRELKGSSIIKLKFTDITNKNVKFNSANCLFKLAPGIVELSDLALDSDVAKIKNLALKLDARSLKPDITLELQADQLDVNQIKTIYGKEDHTTEETNTSSPRSVKGPKWNSDKLDIFRFDKFSGSLNLNIKNFSYQKLFMDELGFQGSIKDDVLFIDNLDGKIFDGKLDVKGNVSMNNGIPSYSLSFSLADIAADSFISFINNYEKIKGRLSFSGSLFDEGSSSKELSEKLSLTSSFIGRGLTIKGVDFKNIVDIASKRVHFDGYDIINQINKSFDEGETYIDSIDGSLVCKGGIMETQNVTFRSYYSNGSITGAFDLTNWIMNTLVDWKFLPQSRSTPIETNFSLTGNIDDFKTNVVKNNLMNFIASSFSIKSKEQLEEEHRQIKIDVEQKKRSSEYIYQKLE